MSDPTGPAAFFGDTPQLPPEQQELSMMVNLGNDVSDIAGVMLPRSSPKRSPKPSLKLIEATAATIPTILPPKRSPKPSQKVLDAIALPGSIPAAKTPRMSGVKRKSSSNRKNSNTKTKMAKVSTPKAKATTPKPKPKPVIDFKAQDAQLVSSIENRMGPFASSNTVVVHRSKGTTHRGVVLICDRQSGDSSKTQKQDLSELHDGLESGSLATQSVFLCGQEFYMTKLQPPLYHGRGGDLRKNSRLCVLTSELWAIVWVYESPLQYFDIAAVIEKCIKVANSFQMIF